LSLSWGTKLSDRLFLRILFFWDMKPWSDLKVSRQHYFIFVARTLKMTLGCLKMLGRI
jgi:hypothetical protein